MEAPELDRDALLALLDRMLQAEAVAAAPPAAARGDWLYGSAGFTEPDEHGWMAPLLYRPENGEQTERTVWPVVLGYLDTNRILIAWCEQRQGFRHFRTDRMQAAEPRSHLYRRWKAWRAVELSRGGKGCSRMRSQSERSRGLAYVFDHPLAGPQ